MSSTKTTYHLLASSLACHRRSIDWAAFVVMFLLSVVYMAQELQRGLIPLDEGTLGLSADYVLHGEMPHRDYHEGYTGGLTYVNALAFRLFGVHSMSLRYILFLFFLLWVPALYFIASRFVSPTVASAVTFLAVAWGPPNYAAPLPSWYNLFFATFGLAALLHYVDVAKLRWLVIAGLCGGLSFLFKQVGLYFIAGAILSLFFREQIANRKDTELNTHSLSYRIFLCVALLIYETFVLDVIFRKPGLIALGYFLVPSSILAGVILWEEFAFHCGRNNRFAFLLRELVPFLMGVTIVLVLFLIPFMRARAVPDFIRDVFIMPGKQIVHAAGGPLVLKFLGGVIANAALVCGLFLTNQKLRNWIVRLITLSMPCALLLALYIPHVYSAIWGVIWVLLPTLSVVGAVLLVRQFDFTEGTKKDFQKFFLILSVSTLCGLVQFPATFAIYYAYIAPLVALAVAAAFSLIDYRPRFLLVGLYCFALCYVVFEVTPGFVYEMGQMYQPDKQMVTTNIARLGGIRTFPVLAGTYETLGTIMQKHARGEYIFATPDCPEIYFFYGLHNPTRYFFDFYDEPEGRTRRILNMIHDRDINLVVINGSPRYSGQIPADLESALKQEFPNRAESGNFEVRWK